MLWQGGSEEVERMPKTRLAERIVATVGSRYRRATNAPTPIRQPTAS